MEITFIRGDIVICVIAGDYGKPRPAVVVQSDLFNPTHPSITICPVTTELVNVDLFRLTLNATKLNGLKKKSQIMVDKISSISTSRIKQKIGKLTSQQINILDNALRLWLSLE